MFHLKNISARLGNISIFNNLTWEVQDGEHWAIMGNKGSGKTSLMHLLQGKFFIVNGSVINTLNDTQEQGIDNLSKYISAVYFQHQAIRYQQYYYQQRYYSTEVEGTLLARDFLYEDQEESKTAENYLNLLQINQLLNKEFIKLSNGEMRRLMIARALLKPAKILMLDNPYIGLDAESREMLNSIIDDIAGSGIQIIITGNKKYLPDCITHFLYLDNCMIVPDELKTGKRIMDHTKLPEVTKPQNDSFRIALQFNNLSIRYKEKYILKDINWTVRKGEKWVLTGPNGAGKSMILSLIFADHPQAYANDIILFDIQRGSGETIWDIKEKIGYLSPEMHFYFNAYLTCEEIVLQNVYENPYRRFEVNDSHREFFHSLLEYFSMDKFVNRRFHTLSTSEQRIILLIRTLVKNSPMLLLDEPFQGFDIETIEKSKCLLNHYCKNRTLILVTHDSSEVFSVINRAAELKNGELMLLS